VRLAGHSSPPWTYRYLSIEDANLSQLNDLGRAGWEVVGGGDAATGKLVLKRPGMDFRERVTLEQRRRVYEEHGVPLPDDEDPA
jgi:hypothetical protein